MLGWAALAFASVTLEGEPTQGLETVVALVDAEGAPDAGETVRVIHRPGLSGEREIAIGITDGRGRVRWTPELSGVARVRAGESTLDLSIAPATTPTGAPSLLALLVLTAVGALGYGAWSPRR